MRSENEQGQTSRSFASWATKDDPHFVYELRDIKGRLIYVGCSINPGGRLASHARKPWWKHVADIKMTRYPDRKTALYVENDLIREHMPPENIQGVPWAELERRLYTDA